MIPKAMQHAWYDFAQSPGAEQPLDGSSPRMSAMKSSEKNADAKGASTGLLTESATETVVVAVLLTASPMERAARTGASMASARDNALGAMKGSKTKAINKKEQGEGRKFR